jgi:hypothetical protein
MLSFYQYSCCYELEYSQVDTFLIYELAYSPCIMFILCLTRYSHVSIFMVYELVYSSYDMFMLYLAKSFNVHIMCMIRYRLMLRWWFIMLSGTPKSFTYQSIGLGT